METTHNLAVYGTLKKGYNNHRLLHGCELLGSTWIENFALVREGYYPAAFRFAGTKIWAEVYRVNETTLAYTDKLEGVDNGYFKRLVVPSSFGQCFMYSIPDRDMVALHDRWYPDGIWEGQWLGVTQWLGWQNEIKLRDSAAQRRREVQSDTPLGILKPDTKEKAPVNLYNPPDRRTGQMVKMTNTETGESEYIHHSLVRFDTATDKWVHKTTEERVGDAAEWLEKNSSKVPFIPTHTNLTPRVTTEHEKARARIQEGLKMKPAIPEEKIA